MHYTDSSGENTPCYFCFQSQGISHYHETLGENILGVELEFSGLDIKFNG